MKRLVEKNINSIEEYNNIYQSRANHIPDEFDIKRWNIMLKYFQGGNLLDMGCFDSLLPELAQKKYPESNIYGIDFADQVIDDLKKLYPDINYLKRDVYNTGFLDNLFDYVTAGELLEHLDNPKDFIQEAFRILKPTGVLVLSTPLEETGIGEIDKDRHIWSFTKKDIFDLLFKFGWVETKIIGSQYFPKYKYHFPILIAFCRKYEKI